MTTLLKINRLYILSLVILVQCMSPLLSEKDKLQILNVMKKQENCWNKGDIECFMEGYWKSDSLKFIGKSGITYGWQNTLDNYKKKYPGKAAMGRLDFEIISLEALGTNAVLLIGKWTLTRESDSPNGHFSLIWKKIKGVWVIVADHSS